ncbi:uncharacterized protein MAM_03663 [Metarhizium album ARSEF 1941]|uniref:Uncharacterized protein n=1 Tax=Metarhizium album (strain ARSEF 1941) TaxID=1081103 RepID=A0A0B2WY61_METAS|nr:uncharacterized protein MAM_03663 [Metarhizium album ARSEF 1941]KHN98539.1 hypothetical protein MAM_03663 [Metarhizium album ARSEF 1941]
MSPPAERSLLSSHSHHGEPAAPTTPADEPGKFEKALRKTIHKGWTKLCAATAKCDQCQLQGREVLQKCLHCSWCICRECSEAIPGPLKNNNHLLDHNSADWETPPKKSDSNAKKTAVKRAKRDKTARPVEKLTKSKRNPPSIIEVPPATGGGEGEGGGAEVDVQGQGQGQGQGPPLKVKADKATQTTSKVYTARGDLDRFLMYGDEENAAKALALMQSSHSLESDRQQHPATRPVFSVPSRVLLPNSPGPRYPSSAYWSGNPLPPMHTTAPGVTMTMSKHPTQPSPPPFKLPPPTTSTQVLNSRSRNHQRSGECGTYPQTQLPSLLPPRNRSRDEKDINPCAAHNEPHHPYNNKHAEPARESARHGSGYHRRACLGSAPPRPYEIPESIQPRMAWARVGKESLDREQPLAGWSAAGPWSPAPLHRESADTNKSALGRRGRSSSRSPGPEPVSKKHQAHHDDKTPGHGEQRAAATVRA